MSAGSLGRCSSAPRDERRPVKPAAGQAHRSGSAFLAALERETEVSLCKSASWRAGKPLLDQERWAWTTSERLGSRSGVRAHGGRWPGKDQP